MDVGVSGMMDRLRLPQAGWAFGLGLGLVLSLAGWARAQLPGLPGTPSPPGNTTRDGAGGKEGAKGVASTTGPITLKERVSDEELEKFLDRFLPEYPGVRS